MRTFKDYVISVPRKKVRFPNVALELKSLPTLVLTYLSIVFGRKLTTDGTMYDNVSFLIDDLTSFDEEGVGRNERDDIATVLSQSNSPRVPGLNLDFFHLLTHLLLF